MIKPLYVDITKNAYSNFNNKDFMKRLKFARDLGCNNLILYGDQPYRPHISNIIDANNNLMLPFQWISFCISKPFIFIDQVKFLESLGVSTIILEIASLDSSYNAEVLSIKNSRVLTLDEMCSIIKENSNMNISLQLYLTEWFDQYTECVFELFDKIKLYADQVSFLSVGVQKILLKKSTNKIISFISQYPCSKKFSIELDDYIDRNYIRSAIDENYICSIDSASIINLNVNYNLTIKQDNKLYVRRDFDGGLIF